MWFELKSSHLSFAERYLARSDACVRAVYDHLANSAIQIVPDTVLLAINSVFTFFHLVVGILLTGCQKLGVKTQSVNVGRNGKTVDGSSIFWSIFRAYGIPLEIFLGMVVEQSSKSIKIHLDNYVKDVVAE